MMIAASTLTFRVMGVFRVTGPSGNDRTPRSMKSRGLLALLLDAPDYCRARSFLQDHLWSDRQHDQGASSLRQTLSEVRRVFGPHRDVLETDGRLVRLRPAAVRTDDTPPDPGGHWEFLEDIDIRDPEFENWLRDRRQRAAAAVSGMSQTIAQPMPVTPPQTQPDRPRLILEGLETGNDSLLARYLASSIAKGVGDRGSLDILSDHDTEAGDSLSGLALRVEERRDATGSALSLSLRSLRHQRVLWSTMAQVGPQTDAGLPPQLAPLVGLGVDQVVNGLVQAGTSTHAGASDDLFPIVDEMLRTRGRDNRGLSARFDDAFEADPRGVTLAWQALLRAFAFGERHRGDTTLMRDEARDLVTRAVEMEPQNPLVLALSAHIYTFLLDRPQVAVELGIRALRIDPANAFGWSSIGYARLSQGELEEAYRSLTQARALSGEGPHRPMLDFLFGMSAILSGRFEEGAATLETVNALAPDFQPPLRYLLAGYLAAGDHAKAEETVERLRRLEPGFDVLDFAEPDYPTPLLRHGNLLDFKKLPRLR